MSMKREKQYDRIKKFVRENKEELGVGVAWAWHDDPKRFAFTAARYKFVSKLIEGKDTVLEVGCGDGFFSRIVRQNVKRLVAADFDKDFILSARKSSNKSWDIEFRVHDFLSSPIAGQYDAVYALDVLEHIPKSKEDVFLGNVFKSLTPDGAAIFGVPSKESQRYASKQSKLGHVNCKTQLELRKIFSKYFRSVFLFSMNDEVVHTGFAKMSHYNFVVASVKRETST